MYKVTNFYPALDKVISELKGRFSENDNDIICSLMSLISDENPNGKAFETVGEFYNLDVDILKNDHKLFGHLIFFHISSGCSVPEMFKLLVENETLSMIPELAKAIETFHVIPATSCSSERSFRSLRRLKTYLRSTMSQERLTNLAIFHIEREFVNTVITENMEDIINKFSQRAGRQTYFLNCY